jgi:hypothetical protein
MPCPTGQPGIAGSSDWGAASSALRSSGKPPAACSATWWSVCGERCIGLRWWPQGPSAGCFYLRLRGEGWRRTGKHAVSTVAQRRREGSRGLQPTVVGEAKSIARRGATPEIGEGCIRASLCDAWGWAAPESWVKPTATSRAPLCGACGPMICRVWRRPRQAPADRFRRLTSAATGHTRSRRRKAADRMDWANRVDQFCRLTSAATNSPLPVQSVGSAGLDRSPKTAVRRHRPAKIQF